MAIGTSTRRWLRTVSHGGIGSMARKTGSSRRPRARHGGNVEDCGEMPSLCRRGSGGNRNDRRPGNRLGRPRRSPFAEWDLRASRHAADRHPCCRRDRRRRCLILSITRRRLHRAARNRCNSLCKPFSPSILSLDPHGNLWVEFRKTQRQPSPRPPGILRIGAKPEGFPVPKKPRDKFGLLWSWPLGRRSGCVPAEPYHPPSPLGKYHLGISVAIRRRNQNRGTPMNFSVSRWKSVVIHLEIPETRPQNLTPFYLSDIPSQRLDVRSLTAS